MGFDLLDDVLPPRFGARSKVVGGLAAGEVPGGVPPPVLAGPV